MSSDRKTVKANKVLGVSALAAVVAAVGCNRPGGTVSGASAPAAAQAAPVASAQHFGTSRSISLLVGRTGPAVASLGSASAVLVAGGRTAHDAATDTAEVLDTAQGFSTPLPEKLATARADARAVMLLDGRVLVLGGHDAQGRPLATTEVFDPLANAFAPGPKLQAARDGSSVATISSSRIAIVGGTNEPSVEVLDLVTLKGKTVGSLARPHRSAQLRVIDSTLVIAGGEDAPEAFDLATGTASTPTRDADRSGEALLPRIGAVLLVGGVPAKGDADAQAHELATPFRTIDALRSLGTARAFGQSVPFGGGELLAGGRDALGALVTATDLVADDLSVTAGPDLHFGRLGSIAVRLPNGAVALVGGDDATGEPLADCDVLCPPGAAAPDASKAFAAAQAQAARDAKLESDLQSARADVTGEKATLDATIADLTSVTRAKKLDDQTIVRLGATEQAALASLKAANAQLAQTQAQLAQVQGQLQQTQAQLSQTQAQLQQAQTRLAQANATAQAAQQQVASLTGQLASANQTIAQQNGTISQQNATISQQGSTISTLRSTASNTNTAARGQVPTPAPAPAPSPSPSQIVIGNNTGSSTVNAAPTRSSGTSTPSTAVVTTGPLPTFGSYAGGFWLNSVSPGTVNAGGGATVELEFSTGLAPVGVGTAAVYFSGAPGQIVGKVQTGPAASGVCFVTVPNLPAGQYQVQLSIGNFISNTQPITLK